MASNVENRLQARWGGLSQATELSEREHALPAPEAAYNSRLQAAHAADFAFCEAATRLANSLQVDENYGPGFARNEIADAKQRVVVIQTATWVVRIEKERDDEPLGIEVAIDMCNNMSLSRRPEEDGPVRTFCEDYPDMALMPGDRITEVNGQRGEAGTLLAIMQRTRCLAMRIRRNVKFVVVIRRVHPSGNLGLNCRADGKNLVVDHVREGGDIAEANRCALAGSQIFPGNVIERVNGVPGDPSDLLACLTQAAGDLDLSLRRTQ